MKIKLQTKSTSFLRILSEAQHKAAICHQLIHSLLCEYPAKLGLCVQLTVSPQLDGSQSIPEGVNVWHKSDDLLCNGVAYRKKKKTAEKGKPSRVVWVVMLQGFRSAIIFNRMLTVETPYAARVYVLHHVLIEILNTGED